MDHPSRYALVEIENVHDQGLEFAPIHRVIFGLKQDIFSAMQRYYRDGVFLHRCKDQLEMSNRVQQSAGTAQAIGVISPQGYGVVEIDEPIFQLAGGHITGIPGRLHEKWGG